MGDTETVRRSATANAPLGRIASPDEIAKVALFLASDDSSYLVGETVNANGGTDKKGTKLTLADDENKRVLKP